MELKSYLCIMKEWEKYFEDAGEAFEEEKFKVCIKLATKAIAAGCELNMVYVIRGMSYHALKKWKLAIHDLGRIVARDIIDTEELIDVKVDLNCMVGICYYELNLFGKAIKIFNLTIKADPENAEAWLKRGICYANLNYPKHALRDFNQAEKLRNRSIELYGMRGDIEMKKKNFDKG